MHVIAADETRHNVAVWVDEGRAVNVLCLNQKSF